MSEKTLVERFEGRNPGTLHLLKFFEPGRFEIFPANCKQLALKFTMLAAEMVEQFEDGPELTNSLRELMNARNGFIRIAFEQWYAAKETEAHANQA